jgi:hypothetical protein
MYVGVVNNQLLEGVAVWSLLLLYSLAEPLKMR